MFEKIRKIFGNELEPTKPELTEFTDLTDRLVDLMVEFTLLTLRTVGKKKETPLNISQIEETVNFDLQFRIQQIQDPELLDIVRERVISEYKEERE
jgi:hypothetical protein